MPAKRKLAQLTHVTARGEARMVDVSAKAETDRIAVASGVVQMSQAALDVIRSGSVAKGDVLAVARIAGLSGVKRTHELIPLCHPLRITGADVQVEADAKNSCVRIRATVCAYDRTGVEMEALFAVTVAALAVYDMVKAIDRGMVIGPIQLEKKSGGQSGTWVR